MKRLPVMIVPIILLYLGGCTPSLIKKIFHEQEWGENYARTEGVTCTTPEMIDGDMKTVGVSSRHEIIITLPERKPIHRILIRDTNIEDFILYASEGSEGDWKQITKQKNNKLDTIDIRVGVVTDKLRFRIGGTFDDERMARKIVPFGNTARSIRQIKRAPVSVREIELYGFVSKKKEPEEEPLF